MNETQDAVETNANQEFVIARTFDAPRELVWKAWSEADRLAQWWGPKGCSIEVRKLEFKPGGIFLYAMTMPGSGPAAGAPIWAKFVYREIVKPEKIDFVSGFSDEKGGDGPNPWLPVWPKEILNRQTFAEEGGKTTVTLRAHPINATAEQVAAFAGLRASMKAGYGGTFDRLAEFLAKG